MTNLHFLEGRILGKHHLLDGEGDVHLRRNPVLEEEAALGDNVVGLVAERLLAIDSDLSGLGG